MLSVRNGEVISVRNVEVVSVRNGEVLSVRNGEVITVRNGEVVSVRNGEVVSVRNGEVLSVRNGEVISEKKKTQLWRNRNEAKKCPIYSYSHKPSYSIPPELVVCPHHHSWLYVHTTRAGHMSTPP